MRCSNLKRRLLLVGSIGCGVLFLFWIVIDSWIGLDVRSQCKEAKGRYGGDCVQSLVSLLNDDKQDYGSRERAMWALGQLGDRRALPVLQGYYDGIGPSGEPLDVAFDQYELKKAIRAAGGRFNITAVFWRYGMD